MAKLMDDKRKKKYNKFINDIITIHNKNREIPYYGSLSKNLETISHNKITIN